jgi:threonine synthase
VKWTQLKCLDCHQTYPVFELRYRCNCGGTLDVCHRWEKRKNVSQSDFQERLVSKNNWDRSGVWRYRELILPLESVDIVTKLEGNTNLYESKAVASYSGLDEILLKHEGENPSGSFKDRGMTVGISVAKKLGMQRVACASTGNTSASMAAYAARAGMQAIVFIPEGKIAYGKLSQVLAFGARTIQINGDFDAAMALVEKVCHKEDIYLLNSINPFRIEGQKAIAIELLHDLDWQVPDWIVVPGGNLGNNSALSKALVEMKELGLIDKLPRLAVIQAQGANPLYTAFMENRDLVPVPNAFTLATAIKIGSPISWKKSMRGLEQTQGIVEQVSDQEIMDAKAQVDAAGIGAEPASCASVAGCKKLVKRFVIKPSDRVCCILTGHMLKDPDAVVAYHNGSLDNIKSTFQNAPISVEADLDAVLSAIQG